MRGYTSFRRLIKVFMLFALAGGIAYGVAIWLAPPTISAYSVLVFVAGIAALGVVVAIFVFNTPERCDSGLRSTPDTYYDYGFSMTKDESWDD